MNADKYQQLAMRTKADSAKILTRLNELGQPYVQAIVASNGLTNEVGEITDLIKASIEYGKGPIDVPHLKEEIGDALWRLAQLADAFGLTLSECMDKNISKLEARYPDKYTDELALNRDLHTEGQILGKLPSVGDPFPKLECNGSGFLEPPEHDTGMPDPPIPGGYRGL